MSAADDRLQVFLEAIDALPPYLGLAWRGCAPEAAFTTPGQVVVVGGVVAASRRLDIATEGGRGSSLYVIASRSGRDISPFSAQRDEQEIVFAPGAALLLERTVDIVGHTVHVVTELLPHGDPVRIPQEQVDAVTDAAQRLLDDEPLPRPFAGILGKFSGDIS